MADPTTTAATADGGGAFPPFDAALFSHQLFWFALTFGALYLFVSAVAIPRLRGILEQRAGKLSGDLDAAAKANAEAQAALQAQEAAAATARAEARAMVEKTRSAVGAEIAAETAKTEAALAQTLAAGESRIQDMRSSAMANVGELASGLVSVMASRIAGVTASDDEAAAAVAATMGGRA